MLVTKGKAYGTNYFLSAGMRCWHAVEAVIASCALLLLACSFAMLDSSLDVRSRAIRDGSLRKWVVFEGHSASEATVGDVGF